MGRTTVKSDLRPITKIFLLRRLFHNKIDYFFVVVMMNQGEMDNPQRKIELNLCAQM